MKIDFRRTLRKWFRRNPKVTDAEKAQQQEALKANFLALIGDGSIASKPYYQPFLKYRFNDDNLSPSNVNDLLSAYQTLIKGKTLDHQSGKKKWASDAITAGLDYFNDKGRSKSLHDVLQPGMVRQLAETFNLLAKSDKRFKNEHRRAANKALRSIAEYFCRESGKHRPWKLEDAIGVASILLDPQHALGNNTKAKVIDRLVSIIDNGDSQELKNIHPGNLASMAHQLSPIVTMLGREKRDAENKFNQAIGHKSLYLDGFEGVLNEKMRLHAAVTKLQNEIASIPSNKKSTAVGSTTNSNTFAPMGSAADNKMPSPPVKSYGELVIRQETLDSLQPGGWLDDRAVMMGVNMLKQEALRDVADVQILLPADVDDLARMSRQEVIDTARKADQELLGGNRLTKALETLDEIKADAEKAKVIFIPLSLGNHWATLVLDRRENPPKSYFYNSMTSEPDRVMAEAKAKNILSKLEGKYLDISVIEYRMQQQTDGYKCGDYMLAAIKHFITQYKADNNVTFGHINDVKLDVEPRGDVDPIRSPIIANINKLPDRSLHDWEFETSSRRRREIKDQICAAHNIPGLGREHIDILSPVPVDRVFEVTVTAKADGYAFLEPHDLKQCRYTDETGKEKLKFEYTGEMAVVRRKKDDYDVVNEWIHYHIRDKDNAFTVGQKLIVTKENGLTIKPADTPKLADKEAPLSVNSELAKELGIKGPLINDDIDAISMFSEGKVNRTNLWNKVKQVQTWHTDIKEYTPVYITSRDTLLLYKKDIDPPFHEVSFKRLELEGITRSDVDKMLRDGQPISLALTNVTMERAAHWLAEQNVDKYLRQEPQVVSMESMKVSGPLSPADLEVLRYKTGKPDLDPDDIKLRAKLEPGDDIDCKSTIAHVTSAGTVVYIPTPPSDRELVEIPLARHQAFSAKPDIKYLLNPLKTGEEVRIGFRKITEVDVEKKKGQHFVIPKASSTSLKSVNSQGGVSLH